ncbi:PDE11 [Lepeophtheirus salmonis]|uniref:PDE11 n=1 Tax=Lepeophtheirus salmonis TaxID=72036 RepID=A0A7R8D973_LEPSM|nr:PDE11 [Lepeophtheirus salmonis]CAF3042629.1 PDE11 [Lepeophtheirus salmonis]
MFSEALLQGGNGVGLLKLGLVKGLVAGALLSNIGGRQGGFGGGRRGGGRNNRRHGGRFGGGRLGGGGFGGGGFGGGGFGGGGFGGGGLGVGGFGGGGFGNGGFGGVLLRRKRAINEYEEILLSASQEDQNDCAKRLVCEISSLPPTTMSLEEVQIASAFNSNYLDISKATVEFELAAQIGKTCWTGAMLSCL